MDRSLPTLNLFLLRCAKGRFGSGCPGGEQANGRYRRNHGVRARYGEGSYPLASKLS